MESQLKQIRKQLGLTQKELADIFDCAKSNICAIETGKSPLSKGYKAILVQFLNINYEWFDNPKAPMKIDRQVIAAESSNKRSGKQTAPVAGIPVYNLDKLHGLYNLLRRTRRPRAEGFISIPGMPRCDGAVRITGESMCPLLHSGDLVLYRRINGPSEIFWGEMYLLSIRTAADERIAVYYLRRSKNEGMAILSGENPRFSDTEIELSNINALALVKSTVRFNTAK
jgi:transcriptional regulator with XRE-family HTH domain